MTREGRGLQAAEEVRVLSSSSSLLQQMERPEPSMAPLSSVEQTQIPAKRWVLAGTREPGSGRGKGTAGLWIFNRKRPGTAPQVCLCLLTPHPCPFLQDRNGNQLRSPQEVRWEFCGRGDKGKMLSI